MKILAIAGAHLHKTPLAELLRARLPDWTIVPSTEESARQATVAACWDHPPGTWSHLRSVRLIHSIGAGVDNLLRDPALPDVPLCRVIDARLAQRMAEYVLWGALYFHRGFDLAVQQQRLKQWRRPPNREAEEIAIGIMGLGEIGTYIATTLLRQGYKVYGWSRSPKQDPSIKTYAGDAQLEAFLGAVEVLVCVLPLTAATTGILSAKLFDKLTFGAKLIHCGRGAHLVESDLIAALESGHLGGALLDVFDVEPLPAEHMLWSHPKVVVTPHMAAVLPLPAVADQIAENVNRLSAGDPLIGLVSRTSGY